MESNPLRLLTHRCDEDCHPRYETLEEQRAAGYENLVPFRKRFLYDPELRAWVRREGGYRHPHSWNRSARRRAAKRARMQNPPKGR